MSVGKIVDCIQFNYICLKYLKSVFYKFQLNHEYNIALSSIFTVYSHLGVNTLNDFLCGKIYLYTCIQL